MSLVVNTNIASMNVQRSLASSSRDFQTSMERLSSGKKINSASDDAAGFAIAERMTTQITGLNRAVANVNDGLSLLNIAQATGREAIDVLQRMRELTVQGLSGTNSSIDKENLQLEFETLVAELENIGANTKFNGRAIHSETSFSIQTGFDDGDQIHLNTDYISPAIMGTATAGVTSYTNNSDSGGVLSINVDSSDWEFGAHKFAAGDIVLVGSLEPGNNSRGSGLYVAAVADEADGSQTLTIGFSPGSSLQASDELILDSGYAYLVSVAEWVNGAAISHGKSLASADITVDSKANDVLVSIDAALRQRVKGVSQAGSIETRLEFTLSNLLRMAETTEAARSNIRDADFAVEAARLAKAQVLQQSGVAMLAQANAQPQMILSLIRQ